MNKLLAAAFAALLSLATAPAASADVVLEVIDRGVPTDGTRTMDGFRAFVLRVTSDVGPITFVDTADGPTPADVGIYGDLHQQWTDPTGNGDYTVTSPVDAADNTVPTDLNFDSHLLPPPPGADVRRLEERYFYFGDYATDSPLPSTRFVGYSDPPDVFDPVAVGIDGSGLVTYYVLPASAGVTEVDVAYLVTDSVVNAFIGVGANSRVYVLGAQVVVPEPGGGLVAMACLATASLWRRRRPKQLAERAFDLEPLEARRLLAVGASDAAVLAELDLNGGSPQLIWDTLPAYGGDYKVWSKPSLSANSWTLLDTIPTSLGNQTYAYPVALGSGDAREYRISAAPTTTRAHPANSYVYAGREVAAVESRGRVLLVIDETQVDASRPVHLLADLALFEATLVADGWSVGRATVPRVDVPRENPPEDATAVDIGAFYEPYRNAVAKTKTAIRTAYDAGGLEAAILIGHVPVPYSGYDADDGHGLDKPMHYGPWTADGYYGVMDAESVWTDSVLPQIPGFNYDGRNEDWPENSNFPDDPSTPEYEGDGKFDQDVLPPGVDVDVAIGRIDFAHLGGYDTVDFASLDEDIFPIDESPAGRDEETRLLKNYLANKNHAFRTGQWDVERQALVDDNLPGFFGPDDNNALRLAPLVGRENVVDGQFNIRGSGQAGDPSLTNDTWLFVYGSAIADDPNPEPFYPYGVQDVTTDEDFFVESRGTHRSVFNMLYASYVSDWDKPRNPLRAMLADEDGYGLTVTHGWRPDWFFHPMGLGEPVSSSVLLTQNRGGVIPIYPTAYQPAVSPGLDFSRNMQASLLGDPTLRLHFFEGAGDVRAEPGVGGGVDVSWAGSPAGGVDGYRVYRAESGEGPYERVFAAVAPDSPGRFKLTDPAGGDGSVYMVRAERLEVTPSGSYRNLSTGAFSPALFSGDFGYASKPNTIGLTFTADIVGLNRSDLLITKTDNDPNDSTDDSLQLDPQTDYTVTYHAATRRATVTISNAVVNTLNDDVDDNDVPGVLPDGAWTAQIMGGPAAGGAFKFVSLTADADNDGAVTAADFAILRANFGRMGSLFGPSDGDFDFDDDVDVADFAIFRRMFGTSVGHEG